MTTLSIKLPVALKLRLELEAQQSGRSVSAVIREAATRLLEAEGETTSLYDRTRDLCGAGSSGLHDLATNPCHLEGFGG